MWSRGRLPSLQLHVKEQGGASTFTGITERGAERGVCMSVQHLQSEANGRADEVKYSRSQLRHSGGELEMGAWRGGLLLTHFSFAPVFSPLCPSPDNMSAQRAHYARRHFPLPSRGKPAQGQVSIIHR